ncbi:hypothetical protein E8E13_004950 [Curvularia kusanoi]|uniref:Uncharacterized protein n=1 Tax=Curvularia kusanoi TaxID=90978 RepID=A0A9P4TPI5_CURKU|nr:hypothetical protein E8E13_004950 [Curvularia kusanoi]
MSRRSDKASSSTSLPKPAPENIATREYYSTIPEDEADFDVECPSPKSAPEETDEQGSSEQGDWTELGQDGQPVLKAKHSPSPSEILLQSDLQDQMALGELDREMREKGRTVEERKEKLLALRGELEREREVQRSCSLETGLSFGCADRT